ncbi:MAG: hypothetical protein HN576_17285 [Bacteriovoracaceae bacterium]|nr:hypothetical protein [Bacteriovoracaceae bacterium]
MSLNDQVVVFSKVIIKSLVYFLLPFIIYTFSLSFERKLASRSVGKMGRYRSRRRDYITFIQDILKIFYKKPITYLNVSFNRLNVSPAVAFGLSALPLSVLPLCESFLINNEKLYIEILASEYSLLLFLGLNTLNIFSVLIIGWGINSNFSILSNLKRSMNYLASELILLFIVINMIISYGSADFHHIVIMQKKDLFDWVGQLGIIIQPVLAIIYMYYLSLCANFINTKFIFDLQNSQQGISYNLNSVGLILLKLSEQLKFFINGLIFCFLFLGGYSLLPGLSYLVEQYSDSLYILQVISLLIKTSIVAFISILLRQSSFNLRSDQILKYAWKNIIPILYLNTMGTIIFMLVTGRFEWV